MSVLKSAPAMDLSLTHQTYENKIKEKKKRHGDTALELAVIVTLQRSSFWYCTVLAPQCPPATLSSGGLTPGLSFSPLPPIHPAVTPGWCLSRTESDVEVVWRVSTCVGHRGVFVKGHQRGIQQDHVGVLGDHAVVRRLDPRLVLVHCRRGRRVR